MKLAELCNTSTSYIGKIEIRKKFPSLGMIERIAKSLHIKPYVLFLENEDPGSPGTELKKDELKEVLKNAIDAVMDNY